MSADQDISRLWSLIRQLQGALGGFEIRVGHVTTTGSVDLGEGFTATRGTTGDYTLTFVPPFRSTARVVAMPGGSGATLCLFKQYGGSAASASTFRLASVGTAAGVLVDSDFWFVAVG